MTEDYPCAIGTSDSTLAGDVKYDAMVHIKSIGDKSYDGMNGTTTLGTSGRSLRLKSFKMSLLDGSISGSANYEVHVQDIGDHGYRGVNSLTGTSGKALRLEALCIKLTDNMANKYDVYHQTHVQDTGWTGCAKNE